MTDAPSSPEALSDALLGAPVAGAVVSPDGTFRRVNTRWAAMLGRSEGWFPGRALADVAPIPTSELAARFVDPAGARPLPTRLRAADGTQHPAELVFVPASAPDAPAPIFAVYVAGAGPAPTPSVLTDAAFRDAPVGLGLLDASFRFQRVNDALAALFELPAAQLVGRAYNDFLHPGERVASEGRMRQARSGALAAGQVERRFITAQGRTVWLRTGGVRASAGPEALYFGVFIDVSARYEAEAEQARLQEQVVHAERLRTLGQIAGAIAHEVNNPAAIAIGGVDLARRRVGAALTSARAGDIAAVRKHLENLEAALRYCEDGTLRIAQAARRLGSFSSLHGGRVEKIDPNDAVRRSIELVRNDIRHRARLVVELGDVPKLVAHPDRLIQAIINLLVNAGQAIEGAAEDHAITVRTWMGDRAVHISVADTGIGMTREVRDRLFEPFFTSRGKDRGTGLGLTVVHDVVRQHRGKIDVWSEYGRGSRFTLELPLDNGLDTKADATPTAQARRVLVIDDEPFLVAVLTEILQENHEVVTATSGRDALVLLAQDTAFDAVLCDLMMPGIDGIEVHGFLLAHAPELAARTVFCTGGAFTARAESYLQDSGVPVLAKPFTAEDVFRCLSEAAARTAPEKPRTPP